MVVASRILSALHHRDPFFPVDAITEELAPEDHTRLLRAMESHISKVVRMEKDGDYSGLLSAVGEGVCLWRG